MLTGLIQLGGFNHPDIYWKSGTARLNSPGDTWSALRIFFNAGDRQPNQNTTVTGPAVITTLPWWNSQS